MKHKETHDGFCGLHRDDCLCLCGRCSTESENPERAAELRAYLSDEIAPSLAALGVQCQVFDNPRAGAQPLLIGRRVEDPTLPTVLVYGHGDVVRGLEGRWRDGLDPWTLDVLVAWLQQNVWSNGAPARA